MTQPSLSPPFGTYALPPVAERMRRWASGLVVNSFTRRISSLVRRICLFMRSDPFDVEIPGGIKLRIYPRSNRCEKYMLASPQFWDPFERDFLAKQIKSKSDNQSFVFTDVGANVGLYALFAACTATRSRNAAIILAVEPDPVNRKRLEDNLLANECIGKIVVAPIAISGRQGRAVLQGGDQNRGEVHIGEFTSHKGNSVRVETLGNLFREYGLVHIDAMKLDIENHDLVALQDLFYNEAESLWPDSLIVEVGKNLDHPILKLCKENGYELVGRTRLNAMLCRPSALDDNAQER